MKTKRRHTMYMAFFLSYVLLLVVTTSSLFVYYAQIRDSVMDETEKSKKALLTQLMDNVDQKMKYADNLMSGLASDNKLLQFARGFDSYTLENLLTDIQSTYQPDYLVNYSVYFNDRNEVVTPGFYMKAPEYFQYMYRPTDIAYGNFVQKYLTGYKLRALGPVLHIQVNGGNRVDALPYIQTFPFSGKPAGQIVILIDAKDITNLIAQINESTSSHVYILSGSGGLMFASEEAPALPGDLIEGLRLADGQSQAKVGGEQMVLTSLSSAQCGWTFVLAAPKNIYFKSSVRFGVICIAVFAVYLAIGLLIGHFLAKRNYRPIKEISDIIKNYVSRENNAENDFGTIKHVLIDQLSTDRKLNEIIREQRPLVSQAYLLSLVKGIEVGYKSAQARLDSLGICFPSDQFTAAVLEFDLDSPFFMGREQFPDDDYSLARITVQNLGGGLFSKTFQCFFLDLDRNRFLFLLSARGNHSPEESANELRQDILRLNDFIDGNFHLSITWGFSAQHEGLKNLPKCYDEAKKALESSRKSTDGILCFTDVKDVDLDCFFPTEIEYQMVDLLKNGNYRESKELLKNIFKINENSLRGNRSRTSNHLPVQVASMLARSMNAILSAKGKPPLSVQTLLNELGEEPTLKASEAYFLTFIDQIAEEAQNQVVRKTELLVNRITDFISGNVEGNPLDLNYIAEKFHITPQYVSNIFKKYRGENIKDYISKLKLERAKELLLDTDFSIYKISVRLGYTNELGIFRLFKKYEHMTPGQYRTIHRTAAGPMKDATEP